MWILYAILGALGKSLGAVMRKKLAKTNNAILVFITNIILAITIALITLLVPDESLSSVWEAPLALMLSGLVSVAAVRATLYAYKHEELSYITPLFALTPLYAAVIAYVTLGEAPSIGGWLGIFAIMIGVYVVTGSKGVGLADTVRHVASNKGARMAMAVPVFYALAAIFNKEAINQGVTPVAATVLIVATMALSHVHVLAKHRPELIKTIANRPRMKLILLASIFGIASVVFASLALDAAFTSYVVSIRRLDVLITVIIGWKFMGDSNFSRRLLGAIVMFVGVVLISFS